MPGCNDLLDDVTGQGDAQGIADALVQQDTQRNRRFDGSGFDCPRFGDADMEGQIAFRRDELVGGDGPEHVR